VIRVILAEDHHLVREGIRALLEKAGDIEVVGEAADGQQAIELVTRLAPDVLVVDIAMPRLDGIQTLERVRGGAGSYLLKRSVTDELLLAIRAAHRGEVYLSPAVSEPIVAGFLTSQDEAEAFGRLERLTSREREVLQLVAEGYTNVDIAEMLAVAVKTVEKHRFNLMTKLEAHNLAELIRVATKQRLVFPDL
jgi:DNA-binding NarL/FixJ family response regulator